MVKETIQKLRDSGELEELINAGILPLNFLIWEKINNSFVFQKKNNISTAQAVTDVSDIYNVSESTVYRVIKKFNYKSNK